VADVAFAIPGDLRTPTGGYIYDREVLARLPQQEMRVRHVPLPAGFPFPTAEDLRLTATLLGEVPKGDILLVDGLAYGALPSDLISRLQNRIVALVHHPLGHEPGLSAAAKNALLVSERRALAFCHAVIVTSATTGRLLERDFAVPPHRITVANPGTRAAPRARGTGRPVCLLAVGAVVPRKAYDVLIQALSGLKALDWSLTIVGATDRSPDTVATVRDLALKGGIADRLILTGAVDDAVLQREYDVADLFVMPSLFEGYGMVLGEAMARGLPILCTTGGAAAETVPDAAGLKVRPGDINGFRKGLQAMIENPLARSAFAEASYSHGLTLPRWTDTAITIAGVLSSVANQSP
jgi:glycosyltransferase involved in cell wall biosynthesis